MAQGKKSVLVYVDWISTFEELNDEEAGKLIKHFFRFVNDKNPEAPDRLTKLMFEPIKQSLKRDLVKYEEIRTKNKENALLRWNKINATGCDRMSSDAKHADSDSVIDSDSDSVIDKGINKKKRKQKVFIPPTIIEVQEYFKQNGFTEIAGERAFKYYSVADWVDSKGNNVINWKQKMQSVWFKDENKDIKLQPKQEPKLAI